MDHRTRRTPRHSRVMRLIDRMYCVFLIQMEKTMPTLLSFLTGIGLIAADSADLDGLVIERNLLIEPQRYEMARAYLPNLRSAFSSSYLTSLQNKASTDQKWPLINLVRQVLKHCGFKLHPKRVCNGYSNAGKKSFRRVFIIQKLMQVEGDSLESEVL